jgi:hypothetical protein
MSLVYTQHIVYMMRGLLKTARTADVRRPRRGPRGARGPRVCHLQRGGAKEVGRRFWWAFASSIWWEMRRKAQCLSLLPFETVRYFYQACGP